MKHSAARVLQPDEVALPAWLPWLPWLHQAPPVPDENVAEQARQRQAQLTKPAGALGELELVAVRLAAMQGRVCPELERVVIAVFAADHGVAADGVSAYPQSVTLEMLRNFAAGGAAISVLARQLGVPLRVLNLGTVADERIPGVEQARIAAGTANLSRAPAMTPAQCAAALQVGREAVSHSAKAGLDLFIGGEMGIGNTTAASALACALLFATPEQLTGAGTGLDAQGVAHKRRVIEQALALHAPALAALHAPHQTAAHAWEVLQRLGGFEIAALTGAYITCAQRAVPVLVDGFITTVAALLAARLCPGCEAWFCYAHEGAEAGHAQVLRALQARPLLRLGLRLGEGSGAALALPLMRLACALHRDMATFAQAGVSQRLAS